MARPGTSSVASRRCACAATADILPAMGASPAHQAASDEAGPGIRAVHRDRGATRPRPPPRLRPRRNNRVPAMQRPRPAAGGIPSPHRYHDPGAAAVTRKPCAHARCPGSPRPFSRLLIDANRGADDPTLIMRLSGGTIVLATPASARPSARRGSPHSTRPTTPRSTQPSTGGWPPAARRSSSRCIPSRPSGAAIRGRGTQVSCPMPTTGSPSRCWRRFALT